MVEKFIAVLSKILRLVSNTIPGKTRLGRMLLRPFWSHTPAFLSDQFGCTYVLPSYAEPIALEIFAFGTYERDTQRFILSVLSNKGTFVDVGANVGCLAIPIAKQRPTATIICIEADPNIETVLRNNVERNGCENVRVVSCVAGPIEDRVAFYPAPTANFGMGSLGSQFSGFAIELEQRTLDDIVGRFSVGKVDVIKIDVEGGELGVLRGAERLLTSSKRPAIVFEFADWAEARIPSQQAGDAQAFLLKKGYRLFRLKASSGFDEEVFAPVTRGSAMLVAVPAAREA